MSALNIDKPRERGQRTYVKIFTTSRTHVTPLVPGSVFLYLILSIEAALLADEGLRKAEGKRSIISPSTGRDVEVVVMAISSDMRERAPLLELYRSAEGVANRNTEDATSDS